MFLSGDAPVSLSTVFPYFLADDLSGALDAAAAFHYAGRRVVIALSAKDAPRFGQPGTQNSGPEDWALGLTTETRNADAATASAAVRAAIAIGQARGATLVYKKIDSTLRGQVAAELAAVLETLPGTRLLLAPANPAVGRTTRDGVLYVQGVPVHETPFGRDPRSPLRTSRIADLLGEVAKDHDIVIPDIETPADFTRAVAAMNAAGAPWLAVGSGGLVHAIAQRVERNPLLHPNLGDRAPNPVLFLAGSAHPLNRGQVDALLGARPVDLVVVNPSVRAEGGASVRDGSRRSLVLQLPEVRVDPAQALDALITSALAHLARTGVRRIFVTGGETAFALCQRLGATRLDYLAELEPGVALAEAQTPTGLLHLAVKPGGFGDAQTWIRVFDALSRPTGDVSR